MFQISHAFEGPFLGCTVAGCDRSRNADVHAAGRVRAALDDERLAVDIRTRAALRTVLERLTKTDTALRAVLDVKKQPGAGDYNRALDDVRQAITEALV